MLQAVHTKESTNQACSLYCRWICVQREEGTRLVAVWMDPEMRAFEKELESGGAVSPVTPGGEEENGGLDATRLQLKGFGSLALGENSN